MTRTRHCAKAGSAVKLLAMGLLAIAAGCGRSAVDRALDSDARGYLCGACTNRFRTDAQVFADVCPRCGAVELLEVVGYSCAADGAMTLAPRGKFAVPCRECGQATSGIRLPTASDLEAWGARQQSSSDVSPKH